ncbi:APC family permease [Actinoplanes auranticolor]|uniref:Amino acid permease n=1 Tax=Actinoplanes auranticolor TaxID=47988 RepID=A0A919S946_9ACTN|nr:APC family permease [Actinoplanes auranticolor]GIM67190.1 amino acid permease [Actinoplanes auranticolor]
MELSVSRGVALYVGALLGPGLLVLPGLAAAAAGPASILAWIGLLVLSGLLAVVFAALGVARPSNAGAAAYVRAGLGIRAGRAASWCFLAGIITGAPVVCHMGAGYLAASLGAGRGGTALAGAALLLVVLAVTLCGVRTSTTVQLALIGVLLVVVIVAVAGAVPSSAAGNWHPFAPHGWAAVGSAAALLMLSFVGWEAIAPLTVRFADPRRRLPRVIGIAFAVTTVVYLSLAAVTIAALGPRAGTEVPLAALLSLAFGSAGSAVAAGAAIALTVGTTNAYFTGGAALARSLTAPGRRSDRLAMPPWLLTVMLAAELVATWLLGTGRVPVSAMVTVPSAFFLAVYLGCTVSGWRILTGTPRAVAAVATVAVAAVLFLSGYALIPALLVTAVTAMWPVPAADRGSRRPCPPARSGDRTARDRYRRAGVPAGRADAPGTTAPAGDDACRPA